MHARDDPPGVLRTVAGSVPCACAGHTCSQAFNLNRTISGWGDCLPIAEGGTVPAPPWYNFSAARSVVYSVANGTMAARSEQRHTLFHGLPRGAWPNCTAPRVHLRYPLAGPGPIPDAGLSGASDNPIRLYDGSLLINMQVCLADRQLSWGGFCHCKAPYKPLCPVS